MVGHTLSHYKILEKVAEGGMGVLYRALDMHLDRTVAIKVLRPEAVGDPERKRRFVQEAKSASALNHPNIITIYDIDSAHGVDFIAMEYVDGKPLDRIIAGHGLPLNEVLEDAVQITAALAAAHAAGIIHRDIKPANIMVTRGGQVKVLDFGLAKLAERGISDDAAPTITAGPWTEQGVILGTVAYMSPEQAEGKPVDARSDIFSLGAVFYEMLAGRRPFQGESQLSTRMAILREAPAPLKELRTDVPPDLERILSRCLEKNPELRYPSAGELSKDLVDCRSRLMASQVGLKSILRRRQFLVLGFLLLLVVVAGITWFWVRNSGARWARNVALPEIARLAEKEDFVAAVRLARQAERYIPDDLQLQSLQRQTSVPVSIHTNPPGAQIHVKQYMALDAPWESIGNSPMDNVRIPAGYLRWRITKEGFETMEAAAAGIVNPSIEFVLNPPGAGLGGMVRIPGGRYQLRVAAPVELQDYWIDKYEVTNKRFKDFVDQGGYRRREFWKQAFVKDGQILSWEQAMAEFRDATGRSGPSTWELGTYPEGRADFPVGGVSWYEAAAYAEFAGKDLPTIYHWTKAAGFGIFSDILRLSNFSGTGPVQVGTYQGLGPFGTYDMAGNVKEWCWNQTGAKRYILGGAWDDPSYIFLDMIAQSPFDRSVTYGFRCVKYPSPLSEVLTAPIERLLRDYTKEKPASDDVFQIYKSIYSYDRTELKPLIESVEETSELWRKEKISFNAAYANERVTAYLFLPKNATPPYQTVVYFPGSNAFALTSSQDLWTWYLDFVIRSGRAVLHPIYQGTYERRRFPNLSVGDPPNVWRDVVIQCSKDLGRSVDYLETRKEIDGGRLAYYGLSRGAALGPIMTAMEPRLKASVLLAGGFYASKLPPEVDPFHFAPRVRVPVLMVNGRQDFIFPVETSQIPCFHLLGTPEKDKRYVLLEGGHALPRNQVIKEILDWLDRYLGPVKTNNTR